MSDEEVEQDLLRVEVERLTAESVEVTHELNRAGAPPDQSLPNRVRQLARSHVAAMEDMQKRAQEEVAQARQRRRLPNERAGFTQKFKLPYVKDGEARLVKGYFTCNTFEDGTPGEIFIVVDQTGSSARGYLDGYSRAVSAGLQYGVPAKVFAKQAIGTKFGPSGSTGEGEEGVAIATSVLDYVWRKLAKKFDVEENK